MSPKSRKGMVSDMEEELRNALMKRAIGFESDEIVEEYTLDDNGNSVLSKRKITKKFNPPDLVALKFLVDKNFENQDYENMTDEELLSEKNRLLRLLKEKEKGYEDANLQ